MTKDLEGQPRLTSAGCREEVRTVLAAIAIERGWGFHHLARSDDILGSICSVTDIVICEYDDDPGRISGWLRDMFARQSFHPILLVVPENHRSRIEQTLAGRTIAVTSLPANPPEVREKLDVLVATGQWTRNHRVHFEHAIEQRNTWEFLSNSASIATFVPPVLEELVMAGWVDHTWRLRVELALQEALTNALEHGNLELDSVLKDSIDRTTGIDAFSEARAGRLSDKRFSSRRIWLEVTTTREYLEFAVTDEGQGFDPSKLPITNAPDAVAGRGIALMYASMDAVTYTDGGRRVVLRKNYRA